MTAPRRLAACATAAALGTFALRYLAFDSFSNDHFQHLARAQQMLFGALPVRDFAESGLPLTAALSAAAQLVLGPGLHAEAIWIALAYAAAAGLSVVAGGLASGSAVLGLLGGLLTVVAFPVSYSYPKLLPYAAGFVAAWAYGERPEPSRLAALAATIVVAFLLRHDHGLILGCGAAAAVALTHRAIGPAARALGGLALAVVVLVSPYLAWVQAYQGVGSYLAEAAAMSRREAEKADWRAPGFAVDPRRPLLAPAVPKWGPIINVRWVGGTPDLTREAQERAYGLTRQQQVGPETWQYEMSRWRSSTLRAIVQDPAIADTQGIERSDFVLETPAPGLVRRMLMGVLVPADGLYPRQNGAAVLFYAAWLVPIVTLVSAWRFGAGPPPASRAIVAMAIVVQLMMCWSMLRDPLVTRVRDVVAPLAVSLPFLVSWSWRASRSVASRLAAGMVGSVVLVLLLWAPAAAAGFGEQVEKTGILDGPGAMWARGRSIREELAPPHDRTGRVEMPIAEYLGRCTPPGSRLLAMTFAPEIFFYARRGFAGGHESLLPGFYDSTRQMTEMRRRLAAEDVPYAIMDTDTEGEMAASFPPLAADVQRRYREVARFPVGGEKQLIVLAERSRRVVRDDGPQNLPCFQ